MGKYIQVQIVADPYRSSGINITHIPSGTMLVSRAIDAKLIPLALPLLNELIDRIESLRSLASAKAKTGRGSTLGRAAYVLSSLLKIWRNQELEAMVGCFWRDRDDLTPKLMSIAAISESKAKEYSWHMFRVDPIVQVITVTGDK